MALARIFEQARRTPDKAAVIHNGIACSYAHFARRIAATREWLAGQQLAPEAAAGFCIGNLADAWIVAMSLRSLGLRTISADDVAHLDEVRVEGLRYLFTLDAENPDVASWAERNALVHFRVPAALGEVTSENAASVDDGRSDACSTGMSLPAQVDAAIHPGGHVLMTSGTTGARKKISRDAIVEAQRTPGAARMFDLTETSVVYIRDFPMSTAGGHRWPLITWSEGATAIFQQWRDFELPYLLHDITHAFATPYTQAWLLQVHGGKLRRDDRMRVYVTAGALPRSVAAATLAQQTKQLYTLLASTEALTVGVTLIETLDDLTWHCVLPGREVEIIDDEGKILPPGAVGMVRVRIQDDVTGYLEDEAASRRFFRDGCFHPGDLGVFRDDGRLSLHGRVTDVINVLGAKIAAGPIEKDVQDRLGADEVCIFSTQETGTDEDVHVVIQSRRPVPRADLEQLVKAAPFVGFPHTHFHFVDSFPRNVMGKIQRSELKLMLWRRGALGAGGSQGEKQGGSPL